MLQAKKQVVKAARASPSWGVGESRGEAEGWEVDIMDLKIKRSPALQPLSRDHHRALFEARELIRAGPENAQAAAARFVRFLAGHEVRHFGVEESLVLPAVPLS
jgi:hypothetical protein